VTDTFPHPADTFEAAAPAVSQNVGHGHVFARPDGRRSRCGGPALCRECSRDAAVAAAQEQATRERHAVTVARLRGLVALLRGNEPVKRGTIVESLELSLADLDPPVSADAAPAVKDDRVHSRACGIHDHAHGPACHPNCPTCGGKPL
jgi:hypothetical protein